MSKISIEEQIEQLDAIGILSAATISLAALYDEFDKDTYEEEPYTFLVSALAFAPSCEQIMNFEMGSIEPQPGYAEIFTDLETMTGKALGLDNIKDNFKDIFAGKAEVVDDILERSKAVVEFTYNGTAASRSFVYGMEYLDSNVFYRYNELLRDHGSDMQIYHVPEFVYLALTKAQYQQTKKLLRNELEVIKYDDDYEDAL